MLNSLFGDLPPPRLPGAERAAAPVAAHATGGAVDATRPAAARGAAPAAGAAPVVDVLVDASPAEAMRRHFAAARGDLQRASAMVTLLDPSRLWAAQVVHALSDAAGQPVQRLNLRDRATLRTLAVVERTLVPRRGAPPLRVYHADPRDSTAAHGLAQDEIGTVLAEGSQMTAVIVGTMQPHALVALLRGLLDATRQPEWRCPWLVFILPPAAAALRQRILEQPWPATVRATAVAEPLASAASVWNCVLGAWEASQGERLPLGQPAARQQALGAAFAPPPPAAAARPAGFTPLPADQPPMPALNRLLAPLARSEGLLACGVVDLARGDLLASQARAPLPQDLAALALALCAARQAHLAVAGGAAPDEILITAGAHQALLRSLPGGAGLGFVALVDRAQANLSLLRFKLLDAERLLA